MPRKGILFILVGPSGAGKNTLMRRVQPQVGDLPQLATATTRAPRPGEQEGREHVFKTPQEFQRLIDTGALIEYQKVHRGDLYGTPRQTIEDALDANQDLIADVEFLGASKISAAYPDHTVLIFVAPSSLDTLDDRIRQRGNVTPEELAERLARVRFEMTFAPRSHYLILNDLLEPATEYLRQIVQSERARRRDEPLPGGTDPLPRPTLHTRLLALVQCGELLLVRDDAGSLDFPGLALEDPHHAADEVLLAYLHDLVGDSLTLDVLTDPRFDFAPPHHTTAAVIPLDGYLYFYYHCHLPEPVEVPGWAWKPLTSLNLPTALLQIVAAEQGG